MKPPAPNSTKPHPICSAASLASLVALSALLLGCGPQASAPSAKRDLPPAQVRVRPVETVTEALYEPVVGTLRSDKRATLEAKVSGRIESLPVLMGQSVKTGDLLARLDAAEIKARLQQAEATLEQASREWKRISTLFEQSAATRADYDATESRLRLAEAALAEAKAMMAYVEIRAPFDGVITRKWADVGDLAQPGKPLIGLEDPSSLQLEADVPESLGANLRADQAMKARIDALGRTLEGRIRELAPIADPDTRTVRVKVQLPATEGLRPGQFARLLTPIREAQQLRIPHSALVRRGQLEMVFVAAQDRANLRLVKTGHSDEASVEVLSGLQPGETVVVEGAHRLTDGQPLQP